MCKWELWFGFFVEDDALKAVVCLFLFLWFKQSIYCLIKKSRINHSNFLSKYYSSYTRAQD